MQFAGIEKNSFIDYPDKLSCVIFFAGCNFRCPYCHNPEIVSESGRGGDFLSETYLFDFLEKHKTFLDGVVISGGEPTLNENIFLVCKKIKNLGYFVKLDTNGSRPGIIKKLIEEKLVDYIAMDIKTDPFEYRPLICKDLNADCILNSIRYIMESLLPYEFRTTCVKPFIDENIIKKISEIISGSRLYVLQQFCGKKVLDPDFFLDKDYGYDKKQLAGFRSAALEQVEKCIIR